MFKISNHIRQVHHRRHTICWVITHAPGTFMLTNAFTMRMLTMTSCNDLFQCLDLKAEVTPLPYVCPSSWFQPALT
jgi:hypothetical protein